MTRPATSTSAPEEKRQNPPARWTRRQTLATLSATVATLPLSALAQPPLPSALTEICLKAVASPFARQLGDTAAQGRQISELTDTLMTRLGPAAGPDWHRALCASAQQDIACGDMVDILGRPVMQTEAETLALGALLLRAHAESGALT